MDGEDFQNPLVMETWGLSGAGAFVGAIKDVVEGGLGESVDVGEGAMRGVGVNEGVGGRGEVDDGWGVGNGNMAILCGECIG